MDIKTTKLSKAEVEIQIELTSEETKKGLDEAAVQISKTVKIQGFRPGKVPYEVLEKHVGKEAILQESTQYLIPKYLTEAIQNEKLQVIVRPKVDIISTDPFKFKALVAIYPEVNVNGYDKVKIKQKEVKVTEKDIDEAIENIKKQFVEWKEILRAIEKGNKVEVDFEGYDEGGALLEGTQSKNHPLILGENMMVPGFEDAIIGMKTGEEKDFTIKFPKDYHKETFQSKKVKFHVKLVKAFESSFPEVNEEFVERITGHKSPVKEFKQNVENDLKAYKESEERRKLENELLEAFLNLTKAEYSDLLLDEEVEYMIHDMKHDMERRGLKYENYLEQVKKTEEDLRNELKKEANKRITLRFGLHEIMEKEEIKVEEKQLNDEIEKVILAQPPAEQEKVRQHYESNREARMRLHNSMRLSSLFDRFIEK